MNKAEDLNGAIADLRRGVTACLTTEDHGTLADGLFAIASAIQGLTQAVYDVSHTLATPEVGDALRGLASLIERND